MVFAMDMQQQSKNTRDSSWICKDLIGECLWMDTVIYKKKVNFQSQHLSIQYSKYLLRKRSYSGWWTIVQPPVFVEFFTEAMCHEWGYRELVTIMIIIHFIIRLLNPFILLITIHLCNSAPGSFKVISSFLRFCLLIRWCSQGTE